MNKIIPTVFSTNKKKFDERFTKLIRISKDIQIDIMDGHFVRNESVLMKQLPDLRKYKNNFEIHLMVRRPEKYLKQAKEFGFKKIIFHYESFWNNKKAIEFTKNIKKKGMKAFIALNPETSVAKIIPLLKEVEGILIMGVHPGREHQELIPRTFYKIKEIRKHNKSIPIQIDGGVSIKTINKLKDSGATIFNSGSYISNSDNPMKAIKNLQEAP
jgi:ribulose-phosphate 3-epimerase